MHTNDIVSPFKRITQEVQDEHNLCATDVSQLDELHKVFDPRVISYCEKLQAHKDRCPICSWPWLYPTGRRVSRFLTKVFKRKVW